MLPQKPATYAIATITQNHSKLLASALAPAAFAMLERTGPSINSANSGGRRGNEKLFTAKPDAIASNAKLMPCPKRGISRKPA